MLYPARYTKPLSENFPSDADKLIQIVNLVWRDMDNPNSLKLDEWQEWLLRHILERYPDDWHNKELAGKLRLRSCVVSIPRQSGKSLLGAILGLYGVAMRTGQTLSLASSETQARIIYDRVLSTIMGNSELRAMFKKTTERRGIVSGDGLSRYDIRPAKESALQGLRVDTTLLDELHITKKGMWTAVIQGSTAAEDGIVIGLTTAGDANSETLIELYKQGERAVNGDPELERFGFFCWEAPEGCKIDEKAVLASNPAVECGRIPLERIMSDLATIPEHEARRYRLNQFITGSSASWLPMEVFYANAGNGISDIKNAVLAVDITSKLEHASIVAAKLVDGKYQTEIVASLVNPSESVLYELIATLSRKHSISAIVVDSSRLPNLQKRLKMNGFPIWQLWSKEVAAACSTSFALFQQRKVEWNGTDALLVSQMPRGVAKYSGENWFISRRDSLGDVDSVTATVMALYVAATHRSSNIGVF
jgi:phage terminase large subunit-like protein